MKLKIIYYYILFVTVTVATISFAPKKTDKQTQKIPVILSSRWFHPMNERDTLSTIKMVELFKPDRIDWMYCTNEKQLSELKKRGIKFSLAINPLIPDSGAYTVNGRVKDIDGNKLLAPWMKNWKQKNPYWGCVNNPDFQKLFLDKSRQIVDLGAYGIFVDDSRLNEQTTDWGGCMCDYCIQGFSKYLNKKGMYKADERFNYKDYLLKNGITKESFRNKKNIPMWADYKAYQEESVILFLSNWKEAVKNYAKKNIVFLTNNYKGVWNRIYSQFDVGIAEIPANGLKQNLISEGINTAKRLNKQQFYTFSSDNVEDNVEAVLEVYQAGSSLVIPWDVYVDLKSRINPTRYYGQSGLYAPLYDLIKKNAPIEDTAPSIRLNGYRALTTSATHQINKTPKIIKMKFMDTLGVNAVNINGNNIKILYPKDATSNYSKNSNETQISVKGKLLVITDN